MIGETLLSQTNEKLQVDQVKVRGSEMRTQRHVGVLQLLQDALVELGAHAVELHDVTWVLLDPELVELLHQITCEKPGWTENDQFSVAHKNVTTFGNKPCLDFKRKQCYEGQS